MNIEDYDTYMKEFTKDTIIHNQQLDNWLNDLFYIDKEINIKPDKVYLRYYFVLLAELFDGGLEFCGKVIDNHGESNAKRIKYIKLLDKSINELKDVLNQKEMEYISYLRHAACHIFQHGYEYQYNVKTNKMKTERNGRNIMDTREMLFDILDEYKDEEKFKLNIVVKIHPFLRKLFDDITELRNA